MDLSDSTSVRRHRRRVGAVIAASGSALAIVLSACSSSGSGHAANVASTGSAGATASTSAASATAASTGAASTGGAASADTAASGTLKWATTFPTHWDPVVGGAGANFRILALVYASVTNIDAKGDPEPGLASSWTYNSTGTEVTFHIRPNLKFSDGTPVNADAIKDAITRVQTQQH